MKNIVLFLLLLVSFGTYGQTPQYLGNKNTNIIITGLLTSDSMLNMHLYDTTTTKAAFPIKLQYRVARQNGRLYQHNGSKFVLLDSLTGTEGQIDTTSLSNRINERVKYTDTAQMLVPYATKQNLNDTASVLRALIASGSGADSTIFATQYRLDTIKANRVPYVGATTNVNLGEYQASVGQITLDQTPTQSAGVGVLRWNDNDGTADLGMKGGNVTLQIGQEELVRVVNKTGANLLESQYHAVYVSGAQGQRLKVANAIATSDSTSAATIGVVTENITLNQEGFVTTNGLVNEINTTGSLQGETWNDGDLLFLSGTTAGAITNIKPSAPIHTIIIGYVVYAHSVHGKIYVKVDNGYELDELHNVAISSVANNDGLFYESSTSLWKNKSISTVLGYTPANNASVVKYTDTASMLSNYAKSNLVVKYNDTSTMLSPYLRKVDTATLSTRINNTWSLLGNSGTTAGTNFVGTTDNIDLVFKRNSIEKLRIASAQSTFADRLIIGSNSFTGGTFGVAANNFVFGSDAVAMGSNQWRTTTGSNMSVAYLVAGSQVASHTIVNNGRFEWQTDGGYLLYEGGVERLRAISSAFTFNNSSSNYDLLYKGQTNSSLFYIKASTDNVGIGTSSPNASTILDMVSTIKGFGLPSMTTTQQNAIASPRAGLAIYNNSLGYPTYYDGAAWNAFFNGWSLTGNSGTTAGTNFIGTTDAQDLVFKRNSNIAGRIGTSNTSLGDSTLKSVTSGTGNTTFGFGSLKTITTTSNNTSFGYNALSSTTGGNNTTFGYSAGAGITSGSNNIAIGYNAIAGTTGSKNLTISYSGTIPTFASSNQLNIGNVLWGTGCSGTSSTAAGSLSVGANAPNASAIFDLTSTTQGLGLPQLTTTQINAIASPKSGLTVYNTTLLTICFYNGTSWQKVTTTAM